MSGEAEKKQSGERDGHILFPARAVQSGAVQNDVCHETHFELGQRTRGLCN
jgi:hypothetical protein